MHDITRMLYRTSSSIAVDFDAQQKKEAFLLARKSFGSYITTELLQVFEVFKSFPKQIPGPEDTVLMAGTNEREEMGDGLTTNPVYGCIDLADLVKHRFMRNRPHFKSFLEKLLIMQRPNMSAGMFITLNRIILQICPLISRKDRRDLSEYFKVYRTAEQLQKAGDKAFDPMHEQQLRKVFNFFDRDNSGTIDANEIRETLDKTYNLRMKDHNELVGCEEEAEHNIDDASISTILTEAKSRQSLDKLKETLSTGGSVSMSLGDDSATEEESGTIDFPGFLKLFGQLLL